ncbi:DUF1254 domain-containing protein [Chitinophaga sp. MM2321]|uniref:DUF1254 domain-containing protein n=1 Tax=Chitinophaga sp. MM2321 TaxID=3137178 RepID=UPI0032D5A6FB
MRYLFALLIGIMTRPGNAQIPEKSLQAISTADKVQTHLGILDFKDGIPSAATTRKMYDELDYIHGVDAFMNAYAAASQCALRNGFIAAGINDNDVLVFSGLMDSKSLFLTANADTYYFWSYLDLSKGPLVIETPPGSLGVIDDMWWRWITDFGMSGPDRAAGGKYLLLPPGYKGVIPDGGYFVSQCRTTKVSLLGRAFMENNDPKAVDEHVKKTLRIYPYIPGSYGTSIADFLGNKAPLAALSKAASPRFVEGTGKVMNTIPPGDYSFYEVVNELVQAEPADALDPEIGGQLAAVGIVKGKTFSPDARMKKILVNAAAVGNAMSRSVSTNPRESEEFNYYGPASKWCNSLFVGGYDFMRPPPEVTKTGIKQYPEDGARKLNSRTAMFYVATGITPAMCMRLANIGSQYLAAFYTSAGEPFDGNKTYKIILPPNIPAAKFWSLTLYDNQTRSMRETAQRYPRAGSQSFPTPAAMPGTDGSTTIYVGPRKPGGISDGNWIQSVPGKGWFVLLRLYSPLEPFFDKSWKAGDFVEVKP